MNILSLPIIIFGFINFFRLSILTASALLYDKFVLRTTIKKPKLTNINSKGKRSYYKYRPLVSVVIAAYNEEKVIERTIEKLFQSTYTNFEVIVVNDGSKDSTEKKVVKYIRNNQDKKILYVYQQNQGKAHALNNAIKNHVNGKILMCLDADSVVNKYALERAVRYFRNRNVKALATNVKILPEATPIGIIQRIEYLMGYHLKKALTVGNIEYIIGGVGSMFRTSTVSKVGLYDTDTVTEDIDLTMKVVAIGNKKNLMVYGEDVVVYTEGTLTIPALFKQRFRWKFGRFQTFWKNRKLFFNCGHKYSKFLTCIYLPFQLFSEFTFLLDPLFFIYIVYISIEYADPRSYIGMFLFLMFYTAIAVATDREASKFDSCILLLVSPLAYLMFFVISIVEYAGLIKCIIKWREIIYAKQFNRCGWTPVARIGRQNVV